MAQLLEDGIYKGRILDYGIKKTSKGDPAPTVAFNVVDSAGRSHKVFWQGSFNGGGLPIVIEALLVMGLDHPDNLTRIAGGVSSGVLDTSIDLVLDISTEANQTDPSKVYNKVNWINADGATKFKDALNQQEFAQMIMGKNIEAELMRIAQEKGYILKTGAVASATTKAADIPF